MIKTHTMRNTKYDTRVDFNNHENTGEFSDLFDDEAVNDFINNLNVWN